MTQTPHLQSSRRALGERLAQLRLAQNQTQEQLAKEAGTTARGVRRLEAGEGTTVDTLLRVLQALGHEGAILRALPDLSVRPMERVKLAGKERQRARPKKKETLSAAAWAWGDHHD